MKRIDIKNSLIKIFKLVIIEVHLYISFLTAATTYHVAIRFLDYKYSDDLSNPVSSQYLTLKNHFKTLVSNFGRF